MSVIEFLESKEEEPDSNLEMFKRDTLDTAPNNEAQTKKAQNQKFKKTKLYLKKNRSKLFRVTKFPIAAAKPISKPPNFTKSIKKL